MEEGEVELVKVYTKENQSEALTKTLPWDMFFTCVTLMDLLEPVDSISILEHQDRECRDLCGTLKHQVGKIKQNVHNL